MLNATVGQLLVNDALPEDLRDYDRVLDKKELNRVLREVAERHPEQYREVSFALNNIGREGAQESGSFSFGLRHLRRSEAGKKIQARVRAKMEAILSRDDLTDKKRNELIVRAVGAEMQPQQDAIMEEALGEKNPLAFQVLSGTRGNKMNLSSLLGSDLLSADQRDQPLPLPVVRSYSEGLSPAEYWAGSYGARKGIIATKFATQDAGFLAKQLNQVAHRLVVTDKDSSDEGQRGFKRGLPADVTDADNEGSLLAVDTGPYEKNTVITPKVRKHLKRLGKKRILIRSPLVGGSPSGGVYARDVGVRETGRLPGRGTQVGLQAAQALSEPLSQGQLSAKHSGGVAGEEKAVSGFQFINQLIQVPKTFKGGAAHSLEDGTVQRIEAAPAGGKYITINDKKHYVADGYDLHVKKNDKVEAGDVISDGFPNPSIVTKYKGVGEGRRYFVNAFRDAMKGASLSAHRRNIELLSRGLINHVRMTEEYGDSVPDDVVPYSSLENKWKPRDGFKTVKPRQAVGKYLERPVLHYTIGTKIRPSMLKDLKSFGVDEVDVHENPPPFEPEMIRGMYSLQHDPDWMTRFYGSGLKKSLLSGAQRGAVSDERGTSFVPSISRSVDFGRTPGAIIRPPSPDYALEKAADEVKTAFLSMGFTPSIKSAPPSQATPVTPSVPDLSKPTMNVDQQRLDNLPDDPSKFTPQQTEWNRIHNPTEAGGFIYDPSRYSSLGPTRSKELQKRKWKAQQLRGYAKQYGTPEDFDGGTRYTYENPITGAQNTYTHRTVLPGSAAPPSQATPVTPSVPTPNPQTSMQAAAPQQNLNDGSFITSNVMKPYDESQRVRGYQPHDRQSQQDAPPGLFGTPFGGMAAKHIRGMGGTAGALAMGAAISPSNAFAAFRDGKTDNRLGGLSNEFYDAVSSPTSRPTSSVFDSGNMWQNADGVVRGGAAVTPSKPTPQPSPTPPAQPSPTDASFGRTSSPPMATETGAPGTSPQPSPTSWLPGALPTAIGVGGATATADFLMRNRKPASFVGRKMPSSYAQPPVKPPLKPAKPSFLSKLTNKIPGVERFKGVASRIAKTPAARVTGKTLGRAVVPYFVAADAYGTASSLKERGLKATGDELAAQRQRWLNPAEWGKDHWTGYITNPLDLGFSWMSPTSNLTTIAHGGKETYDTAKDVVNMAEQSRDVSRKQQEASRKHNIVSPIADDSYEQRMQQSGHGTVGGSILETGKDVLDLVPFANLTGRSDKDRFSTIQRGVEGINELSNISGAVDAEANLSDRLDDRRRNDQISRIHKIQSLQDAAANAPTSAQRAEAQAALQQAQAGTSVEQLQKDVEESNYAKGRAQQDLTGRIVDDVSTKRVGLVGYEDVAIPGTDVGFKGFATPSQILSGNFDWNPFYSRKDRANQQQKAKTQAKQKRLSEMKRHHDYWNTPNFERGGKKISQLDKLRGRLQKLQSYADNPERAAQYAQEIAPDGHPLSAKSMLESLQSEIQGAERASQRYQQYVK